MSGGRFINRFFLRDDGVVMDDVDDKPLGFMLTEDQAQAIGPFAREFLRNDGKLFSRMSVTASQMAAADRVATNADAAAFLQKTTFGGTWSEIQALTTLGSKRLWMLDQFGRKLQRRYMDQAYFVEGVTDLGTFANAFQTDNALCTVMLQDTAALRTKLTWALSKLFVISQPGGAFADLGRTYQWLSWWDRLDKFVFGNWRDLIESVTYSIHMARMLTYYANKREEEGNQPDENYAREIMQLFSIGLFELNPDGSYKLDADGKRIPTYTNDDIRQVARCMTGLTRWDFTGVLERYDVLTSQGTTKATSDYATAAADDLFGNPDLRLRHYLPFYEWGAKKALGGRVDIPEGTDPVTNLAMLHDALLNHPNTAPFFATRMIQHLVTSNPSPGYVARVARAFEDNGQGVRGDLKSVWLAIFLDPEANEDGRFNHTFGRVRDGFDVWAGLVRPLDRKNSAGRVSVSRDGNASTFVQDFGPIAPRLQPSIFGAYDPLHIPTELAINGSGAPELQQWSDVQIARAMNELVQIVSTGEAQDSATTYGARSDYSMLPLTGTVAELVERLNLLLLGGRMTTELRALVTNTITGMPTSTAAEQNNRVAVAMQLIVNSTDYFVQL